MDLTHDYSYIKANVPPRDQSQALYKLIGYAIKPYLGLEGDDDANDSDVFDTVEYFLGELRKIPITKLPGAKQALAPILKYSKANYDWDLDEIDAAMRVVVKWLRKLQSGQTSFD